MILNASQEQKPDTGQFAERQFAETQFAEREGQFAENYSANCPWVNFRQIVLYPKKQYFKIGNNIWKNGNNV